MTRRELVLAALAAGAGVEHQPAQVQKLFFLLDRVVSTWIGGPHFQFRPYHYGPFDPEVYAELERLEAEGLVVIRRSGSWRTYALSPAGEAVGTPLLGQMNAGALDYMARASAFVRGLSFNDLVSAIYKAFPEMAANSVFRSRS